MGSAGGGIVRRATVGHGRVDCHQELFKKWFRECQFKMATAVTATLQHALLWPYGFRFAKAHW